MNELIVLACFVWISVATSWCALWQGEGWRSCTFWWRERIGTAFEASLLIWLVSLSIYLSVCLSVSPLWHISTHKSAWFFLFQIPPPKRRRSSLFPAKEVLTPKVIAPRYRLRSSTKVSSIEKMKCCVALLLLILNDNVKTPAVNWPHRISIQYRLKSHLGLDITNFSSVLGKRSGKKETLKIIETIPFRHRCKVCGVQ